LITRLPVLIPRECAFANGELAEMAGLPARNGGWGLLLRVDERGLRSRLAGGLICSQPIGSLLDHTASVTELESGLG
jgi:hypothetical protein